MSYESAGSTRASAHTSHPGSAQPLASAGTPVTSATNNSARSESASLALRNLAASRRGCASQPPGGQPSSNYDIANFVHHPKSSSSCDRVHSGPIKAFQQGVGLQSRSNQHSRVGSAISTGTCQASSVVSGTEKSATPRAPIPKVQFALKTATEYKNDTGKKVASSKRYFKFSSLEEMITLVPYKLKKNFKENFRV